ncbi:acetylornithine transaminase [Luteipulveratus mongoliensis]|uniref:Acetylornithine aminotransferase n=1 Tax=Luteipulveratus mongoliensis TaxID=571913 RepID=A0A0K1JIY8_9MICO|nr:acetylornithine transaminase [Luteipulveratus mongoliensis]AKU16677.1 acetylornithine aminotransferase [Luteipulveratus mongoliensis]
MTTTDSHQAGLLERYRRSLLGVFGTPPLVLSHGEGCYVWDADGHRYLDLVGGIAVNALGHGHPALVSALSKQAAEAIHISNLFTSVPQIELAERLLQIAGAPEGSGVFLANSGAEAIEAAIKLSRRTGRQQIIAAEGAFHGRTTGALALTSKAAYREPFEPLLPGVSHIPYGDVDALRAAVTEATAAVVLEPLQGEAGVIDPGPDYLVAAREITQAAGALLIIDEIQTGVGRTGEWFAFQASGIQPDAITVAKGLGGGVPIGALITFGERSSALLTAGQHGTTFGGNPLATAGALAVLDTIEQSDLLRHVTRAGQHLVDQVAALDHPLIVPVRGRGLLRAIPLREPVAPALAAAAREAGFIVNPVSPQAIRLAPPLIITPEQLDTFVAALPGLLDSLEGQS